MLPVQKFTAFIEQHQLYTPDSTILAAVSGGIDSVLLAHLLKNAGYTFGIAHCNFQLRGTEADTDQHFCHLLASNMQVPFYTTNFDTTAYAAEHHISIQMAARELRYHWFEQIRQQHQYHVVALAHHQNDAIETILLNLTRGTGIAGLHGILPKNNQWVRPLMFLTRQQITDIVAQNDISFVEDGSNASTKYARNKLRHEVIPKLKELNPNLENTFERNIQYFSGLEQLLQQQLLTVKKELFIVHQNEIHIPLIGIQKLNPQRLLLGSLLKEYGFNHTAIDDLISALNKHSGRIFESVGYQLLLDREKLILSPKDRTIAEPVQIKAGNTTVKFGEKQLNVAFATLPYPIPESRYIAVADADLLVYPLTIRHWKQGDYFVPLGMAKHKKLSDFFINQKIPISQKNRIPVLVNGNNDIIWIAGYRLDDRFKLTAQTKKVVIFELL